MDLESGCSALESVEDNEVITPEPQTMANVDKAKIENNGSCGVEHDDDKLLADTKGKGVQVSESAKSPGGSMGSSPPSTTPKGYGLKKWRRIKREVNKDGGINVDSSKILKRVFPNSAANSTKPMHLSADTKQKSEGSVLSTNAVVKGPGSPADGFAVHGDLGLGVGPIFAAGTDSENSEDWSSKSSTAASAPKLRYEISAVVGYARDKNRTKTLSGKNLGSLVQRGQQGKGRTETNKKPRGERVKIEKENSHSSVESDSQSSNFVFMQGINSVTSNGRQSRRSTNYDGENGEEAQGAEQQSSEELQTGFDGKNVGEFEDVSQEDLAADLSWEVKGEKSENHRSFTDLDPLVESLFTLQSAQEALEKELEKFREIGKEDVLLFDDSIQGSRVPPEFSSVDPKFQKVSSSNHMQPGESRPSSFYSLEAKVMSLKQGVILLESKLEEARAMLKVKEARVVELEAILNSSKSPKEVIGSTRELRQEKYKEMETELEGLFRQKIEAEVEYLAISRTVQKLRVAAVDQIIRLEEQNTLALEQAQNLNKLGDAQSKVAMIKSQAEKLETCIQDVVGTGEVLKLQKRVCKFTSCFFIQLILLIVVFGRHVLQSPHYAGVVPT